MGKYDSLTATKAGDIILRASVNEMAEANRIRRLMLRFLRSNYDASKHYITDEEMVDKV